MAYTLRDCFYCGFKLVLQPQQQPMCEFTTMTGKGGLARGPRCVHVYLMVVYNLLRIFALDKLTICFVKLSHFWKLMRCDIGFKLFATCCQMKRKPKELLKQ